MDRQEGGFWGDGIWYYFYRIAGKDSYKVEFHQWKRRLLFWKGKKRVVIKIVEIDGIELAKKGLSISMAVSYAWDGEIGNERN